MFKRQTTGSVVCASCGSLVGVNDEQCYTCGRRNPGLWGYAGVLRRLGNDFGFVPLVIYGCASLYMLTIVVTMMLGGNVMGRGDPFSLLAPADLVAFMFGMSGADPVFGLRRWWTILTAGWLHGSALHIVFNMMWVRQLVPATAELYGPGRTVIIYVGEFQAPPPPYETPQPPIRVSETSGRLRSQAKTAFTSAISFGPSIPISPPDSPCPRAS